MEEDLHAAARGLRGTDDLERLVRTPGHGGPGCGSLDPARRREQCANGDPWKQGCSFHSRRFGGCRPLRSIPRAGPGPPAGSLPVGARFRRNRNGRRSCMATGGVLVVRITHVNGIQLYQKIIIGDSGGHKTCDIAHIMSVNRLILSSDARRGRLGDRSGWRRASAGIRTSAAGRDDSPKRDRQSETAGPRKPLDFTADNTSAATAG